MTRHSFNKWTWADDINDNIVAEIAANMQYNYKDGKYCPCNFGIFSLIDQLVWNIAVLIDSSDGNLNEKYIYENIPDFKHKEKAVKLIELVLKRMNRVQDV